MLKNAYEYDDINQLTIHIMKRLILSAHAENSFLLTISFFRQMFRSKSQKKKKKTGLK